MSSRTVTMIPATRSQHTATSLAKTEKRRVAGYARVSTDKEEQETSFEAQVDYYTKYINERADWEFRFCYTDEGISATSTAKRTGFKKMIQDALAGEFSLIVTKSVSRFARNTVDSLQTIRQLKEVGCEVYFEKENIWTFDGKGELLITIMSSLAQEESRSISENCVWGQRKRIADGKVTVPYSRFLGYDKSDEDGVLKVNEEEAVLVRRIYSMFLEGKTPHGIAKHLTAEGIPSPGGKSKWYSGTIQSMLTNEKYRGDALLQKAFTVDFLSKRKKINEGEVPQYYVENAHPAIIEPSVFDMVQVEIARRKSGGSRYGGTSIFAGKIKCGTCGAWFGAKVWHSTSKYKRTIYQCNGKFKNTDKCGTPHFDEETIKQLFVTAVNKLIADKKQIIADFELIKSAIFDTAELEKERSGLQYKLTVVSELMQKCISENARVALDQSDYNERYNSLVERYTSAKARLDGISETISDKQRRKCLVEAFIAELAEQELIAEFDERLWNCLLDYAVVHTTEDIRFIFKNGMEIAV